MASIKSSAITFLSLTLFLVVTFMSQETHGRKVVGGKMEIKDVKKNKEVQALGRFSVEEYGRIMRQHHYGNGGGELEFMEVVAAKIQVVSGIKYYLKIKASDVRDNGGEKMFESVVVVKPWVHNSKQLITFAPSTTHDDHR